MANYALENYLKKLKAPIAVAHSAPLRATEDEEEKKKKYTDIAPVAEQQEDPAWYEDIYNLGGLRDGYEFGDVSKTILAGMGDSALGIVKGAGRLVEGVVDLATYGVGAVGGLFGADEFNEGAKKVAQYSAVDEWTKGAEDFLAPYSFVGNTGDAIAEGVGQIAPMILLDIFTAGGGTALKTAVSMGTMGASAMGSGMNQAYQEGANDGEAWAYGAIAGAAEAGTELIAGGVGKALGAVGLGKGIASLDDAFAQKVTSKISNQIAKNYGQYIVKAGAEGAEEFLSGVVQGIGKKVTYAKEKDLIEIWKDENLLESFIVGAITSGITQSGYVPLMKKGSLREANKNKTDFITGYTQNEQKVIDAEINKRVEERKASGEILSKADIGKIQKSVEADMERGNISIDTIENTLGNVKYNNIINKTPDQIAKLRNRKSALETEIKNAIFKKNPEAKKDFGGNKALEMFDKVVRKYYDEVPLSPVDRKALDSATAELKSVTEALRQYDNIDNLKKARGSEVFELLSKERNGQGSKLLSSYAELSKKKVAFNVNLAEVAPEKQATYKRAMESGVWNNTNKTHDFVDLVANIEARTGLKIEFADTKKLAENGYAIEGAVVNGVRTKEGIILNANSTKSLDIVVGHEITHILENKTKHYDELREHIIAYAKAKGDYQARRDALVKLYAKTNADGSVVAENGKVAWKTGVEGIFERKVNGKLTKMRGLDVDGEVVADLVGEYLFTNEDYIRKLVTHRNLFQRIFDEIKHLVKMARADSREQKELLRVQRSFEKAFNEIAESNHIYTSDSIKYNLSAVTEHKEKLNTEYSVKDSSVELAEINKRYDKIIDIWERIGGKLDSTFLEEWNKKDGKDRAFEVFKKQDGYKYNLELSTMCKKGVPLFEAIDKIVTKEVMKELNTDVIGKEEKEILYDILKNHHFDIPCAICYVEQARQREGGIIDKFLNGDGKGKLGWNQVLSKIEEKMAEKGVNYKFPKVDRSIATDNYTPANLTMNEKTQNAFYDALKELANEEITKNNNNPNIKTKRSLIKEVTPENVKKSLGGKLSGNLFVFDVLFNYPSSRFAIDRDILYSSQTTSNLSRLHNRLYSLFNSQGGVGGYKTKQQPVVYWADLLETKWNPSKLRNEGGMRNQSNSDFQMYTLLDQAQMYIDMTAKGYYLHAYTKVISELKLFGKSNGKINASLIPRVRKIYKEGATKLTEENVDIEKTMEYAGLDADGNLIFDDIEGINHNEAFMLIRDKDYSKSVGGICIGYSDRHIAKLLDTPEVQLIIGFHDKTNNPKKRYVGAKYAKNYRGFNETINNATGKTLHKKFGEYLKKAEGYFKKSGDTFVGEFTFNGKTYSANDIPKLAADLYLADCRKNNWTPMYSTGGMNFSNHENYYKLLADFSLYDSEGNYAPHKKVSYDMPDKVPYLDENGAKQYMDTEAYIEQELVKEMELRDSVANALADDSEDGIIPQFIRRVNELHAEKQFSLSNELSTENSVPQGKYTGMAYEGEPISPTSSTESSTETETETPTEEIAPTVDKGVETVDTPERIKMSAIKPNLDEIAPEKVNTDDSKVKIGVKDISTNTERIIAKPNPDGHTKLLETKPIAPVANETKTDNTKVAKVSIDAPVVQKKQGKSLLRTHFLDKASVVEDLALKTKNRELQSKFNFMLSSNNRGQRLIGKGVDGVKSLDSIRKKVEVGYGKLQEFSDYMYHMHNIDRMTLDKRFKTANKAVFGDSVTAEDSRKFVAEMEAKEPWVKEVAKDIYTYNKHLRNMLVDAGIISAQTAELWEKMYPHYVPISREGDNGANVNVPLATNRTGVNAPVKKAVGGDGDISALFNTMADRTMQVYRAVARNNFGIELRNTLKTESESVADNIDLDDLSVIDNGELIQAGKNGNAPTFTVFDNGQRVTFEISEAMYEALKPTDAMWQDREGKAWDAWRNINNVRRNLITSWNPVFSLTNGIKDIQDILLNSQHPLKTYANFIKAGKELIKGGRYFNEYMENGGEDITYFNAYKKNFTKEENTFKKIVGMPIKWIEKVNNFVERVPRLAEYIASRKSGASIETAMLDASRVTTNFQAGGDITKWLNRHGFAFLNASVQGALQQVRNIREAKMNGVKGWLSYATKFAIAGLPAVLLNALMWGDDDEYEDLSDYVKDNYYIIGKFNDGTFVRIPKGRTVAVIQDAFEQMGNAITGDDEVDMQNFFELFWENFAPTPTDNWIGAPITQAITNKAWHGGEIVPTRLQNVPEGEQYDETIDLFSKWLGENMNVSPYKINYLLDQYSGAIGDIALPMMTPEATSGAEGLGQIGAIVTDKFSANSTMDNQNVTDFYDALEELEVNANSANATEEDKVMYKYMSSIQTELSDLYKQKREIQGSGLGKKEKYDQVSAIQEQINALAKNGLDNYNNVQYRNGYAKAGDSYFYNDGESWKKLKEFPTIADNVFGDYNTYMEHSSYLKSITGDIKTRKALATQYFNSVDLEFGQKIILYRQLFPNDDTYNKKIVSYLNGRKDIPNSEKIAILEELGMKIDENGKVTW